MNVLHPATLLVVWAALVVSVQLARGPALWGLGLVVMALAVLRARARAWRLLRRVRVFLLVLLVLFSFFTPGELLVPAFGGASPTREGVALAALHGGQLLVVVMLVAVLLESMAPPLLVAGLVCLARPLGCLGLSADRLAVRILLVFRYVESPPEGGWRALLADGGGADAPLRIMDRPLRLLDGWVMGLCLLVVAGEMVW